MNTQYNKSIYSEKRAQEQREKLKTERLKEENRGKKLILVNEGFPEYQIVEYK